MLRRNLHRNDGNTRRKWKREPFRGQAFVGFTDPSLKYNSIPVIIQIACDIHPYVFYQASTKTALATRPAATVAAMFRGPAAVNRRLT